MQAKPGPGAAGLKDEMTFVFDLIVNQLHHQLYAGHRFYASHQVHELFIRHDVAFQQPEKIQVFEFREQVFSVKLVIIKKMLQGIAGLLVFINAEKVIPLPFSQLDLYAVVDAEVKP